MKALILTEQQQALQVKDSPDLIAASGEAIVAVRAAALNHRDLWIRKGQYAGLKYPIVLGSDAAGVVDSVNDPDYNSWKDKEVILYPAIFWGEDQSHQHPSDFRIIGLPDNGTLAQYVKVPAKNLFEKPPHLSFEEAAALPLAGLTAFRAIFSRANLKAGEQVLITGIGGGVALFTLQFALAAGAIVYVSSGDDEKIARAISLGAKQGVNYKQEQWVQELRAMAGSFDLIVDGAGGDGTNQLMDLAKPGGTVVFYGATRGPAKNLEMRRIFWKQLNVLGSTMGSPADFEQMLQFVNQHKIVPIIDKVFPFAQGEEALKRMDDGHQFGKIVVKIGGNKK
jgi:zinc-binding alcohol dehydrogenase/oxidoreductase